MLSVRVMTTETIFFEGMRQRLTELLGPGANVVLYQIGVGYGRLLANEMAKRGLQHFSVYKDFIEQGRRMGMGTFEVPLIRAILAGIKGDIVVRLYDSFFAAAAGNTGKAECHIVRGTIVGAASMIMRREITCLEEKCVSKGDRYCEFVLKR